MNQVNMHAQELQKLGMSKKEVEVYLKLLELGQSAAHPLAKRMGENRTSMYSLLQALQKKGFISFIIKNGVKYFTPTDPSLLINHHLEDSKRLKKLLPELLAVFNTSTQKPKITFYEGVDGIKQIGEILLEVPGSTRYSFMGADQKTMHPEVRRYYEEDFINRRIELGIKYKGIVTGKLPMGIGHRRTEKGQLRELKFVNPKKFPLKIHIDIFKHNKVALYSYHKDEQMGVVIEHEAFYTTMIAIFNMAWAGIYPSSLSHLSTSSF